MSQSKLRNRIVKRGARQKAHLRAADQTLVVKVGKKSLRISPEDFVSTEIAKSDLILNLLTEYTSVAKRASKSGRSEKFTIEVTPDGNFVAAPPIDALEIAMVAARARGQVKIAEILAGEDMLTAAQFGSLIGASHETVNQRRKASEVLGLQGATRALRYPNWQVTNEGLPLPGLSRLFEVLGDHPWTVYRFLKAAHPELGGETALEAMKAGRLNAVLGVASSQTIGVFA